MIILNLNFLKISYLKQEKTDSRIIEKDKNLQNNRNYSADSIINLKTNKKRPDNTLFDLNLNAVKKMVLDAKRVFFCKVY